MFDQFIKYIEDFFLRVTTFDYLSYFNQVFANLTFESFLKMLVIYFFLVWIALIIWVIKDIINRTNNIFFQIFSILTVLIWTPLWIFIYLFIRPGKTLFEKYYEESELWEICDTHIENSEKNIQEVWSLKCFSCWYEISSDFKFCPNCRIKLKEECIWCKKEIKSDWKLCPFCWKNQDNEIDWILDKQDEKEESSINEKDKLEDNINLEINIKEDIEDEKNEDIDTEENKK